MTSRANSTLHRQRIACGLQGPADPSPQNSGNPCVSAHMPPRKPFGNLPQRQNAAALPTRAAERRREKNLKRAARRRTKFVYPCASEVSQRLLADNLAARRWPSGILQRRPRAVFSCFRARAEDSLRDLQPAWQCQTLWTCTKKIPQALAALWRAPQSAKRTTRPAFRGLRPHRKKPPSAVQTSARVPHEPLTSRYTTASGRAPPAFRQTPL